MINVSGIKKTTEQYGKSYTFENNHNPRLISQYWYQNTIEGNTLFLVFYTKACQYSKCLGCNLPSQMSENDVDYKDLIKQIDYVFHNILADADKPHIHKIIISNNGSILDEDTFSTSALIYLFTKINMECDNVKVITIETRPEYIEIDELEVLARILKEGATRTTLEIAIGFEAFDNNIRNEYFKKGLDLASVEELIKIISVTNTKHKGEDLIQLKTYFMLKPVPQLTDEQAVADIHNGIEYLHQLAKNNKVRINMHLNPTYVASGTPLEKEFSTGNFTPPKLSSVVEAIKAGKDKEISIYVGLNDEGLAVEGGSFLTESEEDNRLLTILNKFRRLYIILHQYCNCHVLY